MAEEKKKYSAEQRKRMEYLTELLNRASEAYYARDTEIISNLEYDALYDEDEIKRLYDFLRGLGYQKSEKIDDFIASRNEANNLLDELKRKNPLSIISTGDYSEQIKSIISEILTNSGFLLSKNAEYKIVSTSYLDIIKYNNIFSCTPTISVVIESNGETISSCFLSAENFSSYNKQTLIRKSLFNVEVLLHEKFIRSLLK